LHNPANKQSENKTSLVQVKIPKTDIMVLIISNI